MMYKKVLQRQRFTSSLSLLLFPIRIKTNQCSRYGCSQDYNCYDEFRQIISTTSIFKTKEKNY